MRKVRTLILAYICLLAAGCQTSSNTKSSHARSSHCLRLNFEDGEVASVHPHHGIDFRVRSLQTALYEGLTRVNAQGKPELAAAENFFIAPDFTTYTFYLRPCQWSNGEKVTAYQFEAAWKQALNPNSSALRADLLYLIKNGEKAKKREVSIDEIGVRALDDKTLVVELEHPAPYFLELLANPIFSPLYSFEEPQTVFNGCFQIQSNDPEHICLTANPCYWDRKNVHLESIDISFIKDSSTALALYEKGELDWIGSPFSTLPFEAIPSFIERNELKTKDVARVFWIYCNTDLFPYHNANIRQALSFAIDRHSVALHTLQGQSPAVSPLPKMLSLAENVIPSQGDPEKARACFQKGLEELDLTPETFPKIVLSHSHISGQKQLAEAVQSCWKKILGVDVDIQGSEWNVFFNDMRKGKYQLGGCIKSAFFQDPIYHLELLKDKNHVYNVARWENSDYQQLLTQANLTGEAAIRQQLLSKAESILLDEMPVIPIYSEQYQYALHDGVKNVTIHDLGHVDFKWMDVIAD